MQDELFLHQKYAASPSLTWVAKEEDYIQDESVEVEKDSNIQIAGCFIFACIAVMCNLIF